MDGTGQDWTRKKWVPTDSIYSGGSAAVTEFWEVGPFELWGIEIRQSFSFVTG